MGNQGGYRNYTPNILAIKSREDDGAKGAPDVSFDSNRALLLWSLTSLGAVPPPTIEEAAPSRPGLC